MRYNEWGRCVCGCGGEAFPRGECDADLGSPMAVVWAPGVPTGIYESFTDDSKARAVVYPGEGEPAVRGEFDTMEEAKAWGLAVMRLDGRAP